MQRWSKFQSQSRILDKKIFGVVFAIIILFSMNSQVFGESIDISEYFEHAEFESGFGTVIQTDKIIFEISKNEDVHVKHIISGSKWNPDEPKLIKMLPGKHSNLEVTDEDGDYLRPIGFVGKTFEESEYIIAGQKPFSAYDLVVEYDLENFLELTDSGIWTKHIDFPHGVEIHVDDDIQWIFANSRPINFENSDGINCVGCDLKIEFFDKPEIITKKIIKNETKFEEISNTGEEFVLEFISNGAVGELNYIEELNYFSLNVNEENQLFFIKIPLDLLLSPYHVYLTENDQDVLVESDQIRKSEVGQTETHANLSFRVLKEGVIHVVGSNEMEHEKLLTKLQKRIDNSMETEENKSNSIFDIVKDQSITADDEKSIEQQDSPNDLYENWEKRIYTIITVTDSQAIYYHNNYGYIK